STIQSRYYKNGSDQLIKIKSATKNGFELASLGDAIDLSFPDSHTRRGRVGKGVAQTLDTVCNQGVCIPVSSPDILNKDQNGRRFKEDGEASFTITSRDRHGVLLGNKKYLQ